MGNEFNLEDVRETVALIGHAIEEVDALTKNIVESRWNYEMVRRNPQLGVVANPQNPAQLKTFRPDDFKRNIDNLKTQRATAIDALIGLTDTPSVDAARVKYLALVSAYQRLGQLRELLNMVEAGFPQANEEAAKQNLITVAEIKAANVGAFEYVRSVAEKIQIPVLSDIVLAS
jgi:hypothetical protein